MGHRTPRHRWQQNKKQPKSAPGWGLGPDGGWQGEGAAVPPSERLPAFAVALKHLGPVVVSGHRAPGRQLIESPCQRSPVLKSPQASEFFPSEY